jgi:GrpB-like predicted nucleotidyltransferase (UPF0157 family)
VPYDEKWPAEFEKIKNELLPVIGNDIISIEHVGSTSVKGLYAKPIIDIDIVIEKGMFETVKGDLVKIGYIHEGDLGITGREAFKYNNKQHLMEHHLYVCDKNADELRRHITLRDYLRTHDADRDEYSKIKLAMAKKYPHDIDSYMNGKSLVVLSIFQKCGL